MLSEYPGLHCRIYAPVGAHKDLLPYLVRRLLENGANTSFVHKLVDPNTPVDSWPSIRCAPSSATPAWPTIAFRSR